MEEYEDYVWGDQKARVDLQASFDISSQTSSINFIVHHSGEGSYKGEKGKFF